VLAALASSSVTTIVGFTELTGGGLLHNSAAVIHRGSVIGVYRDVAGRSGKLVSHGSSAIVGPDGGVVQAARPLTQGSIVAKIGYDTCQ
jgi:predicted amidohydrolase